MIKNSSINEQEINISQLPNAFFRQIRKNQNVWGANEADKRKMTPFYYNVGQIPHSLLFALSEIRIIKSHGHDCDQRKRKHIEHHN